MQFNNRDSENLNNDFFDGPDLDDSLYEKKPKKKPDDPDYYDEEDDEWEHLRPTPKVRYWLIGIGVAVALLVLTVIYMRLFTPFVSNGVQYGYLDKVELRGKFFKTYECVMIPYKEIMDTTRIYKEDFVFTANNSVIGKKLLDYQIASMPLRVTYKKYYTALPWRGDSKIVVIDVDTVNPAKILPPEYTPEYFRTGENYTDTLDNNARQRNIYNATE